MKLGSFTMGVVTGLAAAAIGQQLSMAPEARTWRGTVAGVPYNFNIPEWGDILNEYWNPDSDQILTPHVVGLGWGINFAALRDRLQGVIDGAQQLVDQVVESTSGAQDRQIPEPVER